MLSILRMSRTKTLWVKDEYLQQILSGRKTVEIRVAYSNIARLKPGDTLLLNDQHSYTILDIRRYPDFDALVEAENPATIAPDLMGRDACLLPAVLSIHPKRRRWASWHWRLRGNQLVEQRGKGSKSNESTSSQHPLTCCSLTPLDRFP